MSKDIEVGDIYIHEYGGIKLLVLAKAYKEGRTVWWNCLREDLESQNLGYFVQTITETCLKKHHTYLGKAKFMPVDLFKTENE
jgi:hypothetical protein